MSFFSILTAQNSQGSEPPDPLPSGDFQKYYETVVKNSDDQSFEDTEQLFAPSIIQVGNYYHMYYIGNSPNLLAPVYGDIDLTFLARKLISDGLPIYKGWEKYSDINGPIRMLDPGASYSDWDGSNMYLNKVLDMGDGTYRMYYTGLPDGVPTYKVGFATSSDGINWTKYASNPIVTDAAPFFVPYKDGADWYAIAYVSGQQKVYTSNNGISWTDTRNITLAGTKFITDIFKYGNIFYCYGFSDEANYQYTYQTCWSTTDFITFTNLGNSLTKYTSSTRALGHNCMIQTGQYSFAYFYSYYKYRTRLERVGVENPLMSIRCATLTNSVPWATTFRANFPAYVKRFYSVCDSDFRSLIGNVEAINQPASPSYSTDELYLELNGTTDYVEFTESTLPSNLSFSFKMRVYKNLTGTQPLYSLEATAETNQDDGIYVGLISGKLEVKLKNSAGTLVKHYVSVNDVDIPATARDVYAGAWIGFRFQDSTLKLYINNQEVTTTKTVDSAIDSIYNVSANVIIGKNGSTFSNCSIRNITIMSGETESEYINWDMM